MTRSNYVRIGSVLLLSLLAGDCGTPTEGDGIVALSSVSGDNQLQIPGSQLFQPFQVAAVGASGDRIMGAGITVSWAVTSGGGSISPATSATNSSGIASAVMTLGPEIGTHSAQASVDGAAVTFTARAAQPPIVFVSDEGCGGGLRLFLMNEDGSDRLPLTAECGQDLPDWSPDGTQIAFVEFNQIFKMNIDGSGKTQLTFDTPPDARGIALLDPDWSHDGSRIAFVIKKGVPGCERSDKNIYTMDADGTGRVKVTQPCGQGNEGPDWSADGTKIVFWSNRFGFTDAPDGRIYVINADGSGETLLSDGGAAEYFPKWSPDGQKIAYARGNAIWVMGPDGSNPEILYESDKFPALPLWSPDGSQLLFTMDTEIYLLDVATGTVTNLTNRPSGSDCCASWRP